MILSPEEASESYTPEPKALVLISWSQDVVGFFYGNASTRKQRDPGIVSAISSVSSAEFK